LYISSSDVLNDGVQGVTYLWRWIVHRKYGWIYCKWMGGWSAWWREEWFIESVISTRLVKLVQFRQKWSLCIQGCHKRVAHIGNSSPCTTLDGSKSKQLDSERRHTKEMKTALYSRVGIREILYCRKVSYQVLVIMKMGLGQQRPSC
jgi:hypothetical protein